MSISLSAGGGSTQCFKIHFNKFSSRTMRRTSHIYTDLESSCCMELNASGWPIISISVHFLSLAKVEGSSIQNLNFLQYLGKQESEVESAWGIRFVTPRRSVWYKKLHIWMRGSRGKVDWLFLWGELETSLYIGGGRADIRSIYTTFV